MLMFDVDEFLFPLESKDLRNASAKISIVVVDFLLLNTVQVSITSYINKGNSYKLSYCRLTYNPL